MPDADHKQDLKKTLDAYQARRGHLRLIEVPPTRYLMIDGRGDPNASAEFQEAIEALYPVAYKAKFLSKNELGRDYVVMPLEGLWWAPEMDAFTSRRDKSAWHWTLMIMTPDWVDDAMVALAKEQALAKNERVGEVRLEALREGQAIQTLHVGSFDDEGPILERMHEEIETRGRQRSGKHHEIYLSDFRKVAPEKLRTILRQPITPA